MRNGMLEGKGLERDEEGSEYEGQFEKGVR
jgi:hypothetical protein